METEQRPYLTNRASKIQQQALGLAIQEKPLSDFGKRTIDSLTSRAWLKDGRVTTEGLIVAQINELLHPAAQKVLDRLILDSPHDAHMEKWPHWKLIAQAHKAGAVRQKLEPIGGFGSLLVRVTLSRP